jgi:2-polyprenyl-3-methyl-5-hydroxy-6-metoxy-1,4-benzoquinol methylase
MTEISPPIPFRDFLRLGSHQSYGQTNPLASLFFRLVGPLGTHARIRNARLIHTLAGIDLSGMRVLDVGCGHGYTLFWLAEHFPDMHLEGIDTAADQITGCQKASQARGFSNLRFGQGTPYDLPAEATYDLLIAIDVLEHLPDDEAALAAFATALKPGGYLAIHVPLRHQVQQRVFGAFRSHTVSDHARDEYRPEEIVEKVGQAGLEIERFAYGFGYWGELSFELNNLFWHNRWLRNITALATLPLALALGYRDVCQHLVFGNSMVLLARRPFITTDA